MSDEMREAVERLPRLRITGEQLDAIDPDPEKVFYTDWDEWDEYVRLDAVRAALAARPDSPTLDEATLKRALMRYLGDVAPLIAHIGVEGAAEVLAGTFLSWAEAGAPDDPPHGLAAESPERPEEATRP